MRARRWLPSHQAQRRRHAWFNDDEVGDLCRYAFDRDFIPASLSFMPMSEGALFYPGTFPPAAELRAAFEREFGPLLTDRGATSLPPPHPRRRSGPQRLCPLSRPRAARRPDLRRQRALLRHLQPHPPIRHRPAPRLPGLRRRRRPANARPAALSLRPSPCQVRLQAPPRRHRSRPRQKRAGHVFFPTGCGGPQKHGLDRRLEPAQRPRLSINTNRTVWGLY